MTALAGIETSRKLGQETSAALTRRTLEQTEPRRRRKKQNSKEKTQTGKEFFHGYPPKGREPLCSGWPEMQGLIFLEGFNNGIIIPWMKKIFH